MNIPVWIGECRLGWGEGAVWAIRAAARADGITAWRSAVRPAVEAQGWRFLDSVEIMPATMWRDSHIEDGEAEILADTVRAGQAVAFGALREVELPAAMIGAPMLDFVEIAGVAPLDAQLGVWPKATVPAPLRAALFGALPGSQPREGRPALHCYAILDAARIPFLAETLATSRLEHRCLFQGAAAEELQAVAPYLVRLEEGADLTRRLFTRSKMRSDLWEARAGLFLRSAAPIETLWRHLRRFTRVQDDTGAWYYFRFWEPSVAPDYFRAITTRGEVVARWFLGRDGADLAALVVPPPQDEAPAVVILPRQGLIRPEGGAAFTLTAADATALHEARAARDTDQLADLLRKTFPDRTAPLPPEALRDFAKATVRRMAGYGFRQRDALFMLLAWELHYGPDFEGRDPQGILAQICADPSDEVERMATMKQRMAEIEG